MSRKQAETSKSIFRNVLYNFSTWFLPLGLSFFATPILVKALGDGDYGIYALVLGFIGYSFNFSIGRAITKYIAEYRASGENEKIKEVISATFFLNVAVGLFGVLVICLSANWLVIDVFNIQPDAQNKTIYAFYLASSIIFVSMLNQVFSAVLQGIHRFDIYSKIYNINSFVLLTGNILLALYGYNLLFLLGWNLLVLIITSVIYIVCSKRLLPEFGISFRLQTETLKKVLKFSSGVIGYQILANFILLFERGWITRKLGAESLTYYVVPMMLSLYIHSFISSLMLVIFPLASELKDDKEKLLRLYTKATKIVGLLVVFMAVTLIVQSKYFLTLWMGAEFAEKSAFILIIHTITFGLVAIQIISWQMTEGLGFPNYNFRVFIICVALSVFLMITLTDNFGNSGIAISRLVGFGVIFFSVFYVEKWFFGKIQIRLWLKLVGILGVAAILSAIVEGLIISNLPISWLVFLLSTFCGGVVYCLTVWFLGFIAEDEKLLFKSLLRR
jgi:O-antigen/teichoic acid export membrane protein